MWLKVIPFAILAALTFYSGAKAFDKENLRQKQQQKQVIRVVGSSTVYPFATIVAEYFGKKTGEETPIIEATGTGGGIQNFCAGIGVHLPDMVNATRSMKPIEKELCQKNGVLDILEVPLGRDGLVIAGARSKAGVHLNITKEQIFLALAPRIPQGGKLIDNPYRLWSDISADLPRRKIKILGPPPTSGTRDSFVEMVLEEGCKTVKGAFQLGLTGETCRAIREDGAWQDMGENDNLIVQKVQADPDNVGVFGFAYYNENQNQLQAALINHVIPTYQTVLSGTYSISRPLYVYVKMQHVALKPALADFIMEFLSDDASGRFGYLAERGLVVLPSKEEWVIRKKIKTAFDSVLG